MNATQQKALKAAINEEWADISATWPWKSNTWKLEALSVRIKKTHGVEMSHDQLTKELGGVL